MVKGAVETLRAMESRLTLGEIAEEIKCTAFRITRIGELIGNVVAAELGVRFGIVDLSLAPTPRVGDSVGEVLQMLGIERVGAAGSTAALALLTDAVKKGGAFASSSVGGVSGLHRSVVARGSAGGPETLQELIQTDAAINPGNSGGPLLNIRGEVIAINTAIAQGAENIGFAIPINKAKRDLEGIQRDGKITYPFIGVRYTVITPELAEKQKLGRDYGALLSPVDGEPAVVLGGPAEKAGLKSGDIVLEFNAERITPEQTLVTLIQKYHVGDEVTLKVFRDGKEFEVRVKLEERR